MVELSVHVMLKTYSAKFIEDLQILQNFYLVTNFFCEIASNAV